MKKMKEHGFDLTEREASLLVDKEYKNQVKKAIDKEKAHPKEWWEDPDHPERHHLVREVILEREQDSEDEWGRPKYIKERDPQFKEYMKQVNREKQDHEARRARILKENKRFADMGRPQIPVPAEFKVDSVKYKEAVRGFAEQFNRKYDKQMETLVREAGYVDGIGSQVGGHDPNHPLCTN
jgi:hypothetical protein